MIDSDLKSTFMFVAILVTAVDGFVPFESGYYS